MGPKRHDPNSAVPSAPLAVPRSKATIVSTKAAAAAPDGGAGKARDAGAGPSSSADAYSANAGGENVVQWLAKKVASSSSSASGGALAYLKAAKTADGGINLAAWAKSAGIATTGTATPPPAAATSPPPPVTTASASKPSAGDVAPAAAAAQHKPPAVQPVSAPHHPHHIAPEPPSASSALRPLPRSAQGQGAPPPPPPPPPPSYAQAQTNNRRTRQSRQPAGNNVASAGRPATGGVHIAASAAAAAPQQAPPPQQPADPQQSEAYQAWLRQHMQAVTQARERLLSNLARQESAAAAVAAGRQLQRLDLPAILDVIEGHDVTIICTDTGSGKSTMVPNALLDRDPRSRIVTTQPRRTATISIAQHVAQQREQLVGEEVGYWIRGEKRGHEATRLWYMTSYTLLLQLLGTPLHPPYTHVVLDEFHERQPDIEVTVALLKLCLENKTAPFKLVLMSATLNVDDWIEYFKGLTVAVYRQSAPEHPIHDFFLEDVCALVGLQAPPPPTYVNPVVDQHVVDTSMYVLQQLVSAINSVCQPHQSMLVFLPGRSQVEEFVMWAGVALYRTAEAIPWHSAVELNHIQDCITRRAGHRQKIYFATDIAEVSITLPDVVFVIDAGLVKRPSIVPYEPATILYPPLNMQYISQGSIQQRRGRVGRTQQGFYFSLLSIAFVPLLPRLPFAPIQNARIDELALHSLQLATNPVAVFSICHAQPLLQSIVTSMRSLTEYGCIVNLNDPISTGEGVREMFDVEHGWSPMILAAAKALVDGTEIDQFGCTFIGRLLQLIPVSMQQGLLVFYGLLTGLESLMILAAAASNSLMPFVANVNMMQPDRHNGRGGGRRPKNSEMMGKAIEATEDAMRLASAGSFSDLIAVIDAALRFRIQQMMPGADEISLQMWCNANQLSYDKVLTIVELDAHIRYEMSGFIPFRDLDDPAALLDQLHKFAPVVVTCVCAAFASQAQQVVSSGAKQMTTRESALGLFTELKSMPDLHQPSSFRWELDDIIVPVSINLRYSHTLVSYSTVVKNPKRFYLSMLLFGHRLKYDCFVDDDGKYYEFSVTYHGKSRYLETDAETGHAILDFRQRLCRICTTIRLRYQHKYASEQEFDGLTLAALGIPPLFTQQRDVMVALMHYFFGQQFDKMSVVEVEHTGSELTSDSMLTFRLPPGMS